MATATAATLVITGGAARGRRLAGREACPSDCPRRSGSGPPKCIQPALDRGVNGRGCSRAGAPVKAVGLYAADPLVLAAGGTNLDADWVTDAYISETTWNEPGRPSSPPDRAAGPRGQN